MSDIYVAIQSQWTQKALRQAILMFPMRSQAAATRAAKTLARETGKDYDVVRLSISVVLKGWRANGR